MSPFLCEYLLLRLNNLNRISYAAQIQTNRQDQQSLRMKKETRTHPMQTPTETLKWSGKIIARKAKERKNKKKSHKNKIEILMKKEEKKL